MTPSIVLMQRIGHQQRYYAVRTLRDKIRTDIRPPVNYLRDNRVDWERDIRSRNMTTPF